MILTLIPTLNGYQKVLKIATICKQKRLALLLDGAAVAQMYLFSIVALISSMAFLKSLMDAGLTLQTWSLTHPHRKKLQRLQSGECRGQETPDSHKMILTPLSKFRMV